jgi:tRNA-splicing ligase RtcB
LICGSMLTGSYVVEGRGAASSYLSSSHGAGRLFSRGEAFRTLSKREVERDMEGIVWSGSERLKDEAPRAYKDLDTVMRSQRDLVRVRHHLKPVISVKGEA